MNPAIFKAYDIRGTYPGDLDEEAAFKIARAYAALLKAESGNNRLKIAVGADMRLSSPNLKEQVIEGLIQSGLDVDDIGPVSTPTFYFGVAYHGYDGGIQISASHNPKEWNGMKMVRRGGVPISKDTGIFAMRDMVLGDALPPLAERPGARGSREGIVEEEAREQSGLAGMSGMKPFRVVIDAANAMGALDMAAIFRHLSCVVIEMNFDLDGTFPAHEADPMKEENMRSLGTRVVAEKADLGIATDGDGDRIFFADEKGETVPPHVLRGVLAQIALREHPGEKVAYDIRPGRITRDMIDELKGRAIVTPVGHSLIKEMMLRENAVFGGESSGHFFYKMPWGTFEAPMIVVIKLLQFLSAAGKPLSEAIAPYKRYAHSGEINFKVPDRAAAEAKMTAIKTSYAGGKQTFIDGVTVEYPEYWFNVRAGNTEPMLRLTVEAVNKEVLERELAKLRNLLQ